MSGRRLASIAMAAAAIRPKRGLAGLALAMLLSSLGTSVANVALPTLEDAFDAPFGAVQWVVLAYLLVVTTAFCIDAGVGDQAVRAELQSAFRGEALSSTPLGLTDRGLRTRSRAYRDALAHPHPELGRAYSVGRVFARYCDASHEVAVIEFAARTYMAQLPAMLASLRRVTGEQARP